MNPTFVPTDDGLEINDPIERHRYRLTTHESVSPRAGDPDDFPFPVASAVEIATEMITLPTNDTVYVRDEDRSMIAEVRPSKQITLPEDTYVLDLSGPMKAYARVESGVYIYSDSDRTYIALDDVTTVTIGARSYHRRPAGTITTTEEPTDVMKAVSTFGSALTSMSSERSYPTHRGHPPAIELGDELEIPETFERPDTGVRIEAPPTLEHVFVLASLAYYLGADVVPGSKPRLRTENGFTYDLERATDFETTVERVLQQVFFLDCIVRTEGTTPLPLRERRQIESALPFDIGAVYERPLTEQLETYLSVPFETVEPHLPEWRLEVHLEPTAETAEFLPFIADNLAIATVNEHNRQQVSPAQTQAITAFTRGDFTRSADMHRGSKRATTPTESDIPTIRQVWRSVNSTDITSTTSLSAFYNNIGRTPREDPIDIEVVCNDPDMRAELETVNGVYGTREELPFDVTVHYDLERAELRELLAKDIDFVHFIGHIDTGGFQCADGKLDAASLETVGVKAFFLNACQSHDQGLQLVEAGSIGGIVTFDDVINSGAVRIGSTIARLLNRGFPLYGALDVAQRDTVVGQQYFVVGDGMTTIAQSEAGPPVVCSVDTTRSRFDIDIETYTTRTKFRKGSIFIPYVEENSEYFLTSGETGSFLLPEQKLEEFFDLEQLPVVTSDGVRWSKNVRLTDL